MSLNRPTTSVGGVIVLIIFLLTGILLNYALVNDVQWNGGFYFLITCLLAAVLFVRNRQKRKAMKKLLYRFSQLGSEYNLTFSGQEILRDSILGLDGMKRKLLILKKNEAAGDDIKYIDLQNVKHCSVKKYYGTIQAGALKGDALEQYLQRIVLHIEFQVDTPTEIDFYHHGYEPSSRVREMEIKSGYWGTLLNKMLNPPARKIA
jgi:hypothetical protein